jgi:hypothetical protein
MLERRCHTEDGHCITLLYHQSGGKSVVFQ